MKFCYYPLKISHFEVLYLCEQSPLNEVHQEQIRVVSLLFEWSYSPLRFPYVSPGRHQESSFPPDKKRKKITAVKVIKLKAYHATRMLRKGRHVWLFSLTVDPDKLNSILSQLHHSSNLRKSTQWKYSWEYLSNKPVIISQNNHCSFKQANSMTGLRKETGSTGVYGTKQVSWLTKS